jgi:hypothetical protein
LPENHFGRFGPAPEIGVNKLLCGLGAAALIGLGPQPAAANSGSVVIRYDLTLAGLPIGTATLTVNVADGGPYTIGAAAKVGGVISLISDGRGSASATGRLGPVQPEPSTYALNTKSEDKPQTVQMAISDGTVTAVALNPELAPRPDRIPVTPANKHGVIDPLSALMVPVAGSGSALSPDACKRTLPVFDGAQRFDITLSYARTEQVKAKGYSGPAIVCSARYIPIAGHRPERAQTKFMIANRDLELWLTPINGTRVLAPWRIIVGTQIGRLRIDAARYGQSGGNSN